MIDWKIQFYYDRGIDSVFIHKLFYFLVSKGAQYNCKHEGYYQIFPKSQKKPVTIENIELSHMEKEVKCTTEKLAEIIDSYLKFDIKDTILGVHLDFFGEANFLFNTTIYPVKDNKLIVYLQTNLYEISDEKSFLTFVNLCKELFVKFSFIYGQSRSQYEGIIPTDIDEFLKERPNIVNFYSRPLVDKIGREKLLSTPAFKVEELENGGVMLIVCTEPLGCDNIYEVWRHLGYKSL